MKPILIADSIAKSFGARRVLTSATLRAVPGELRVLLGRNGVGKSTLLKIAAGWLSSDSGAIHFNGRVHASASLPELASAGLFYLPDHDLLSTAFSIRRQLEMIRLQFDGSDIGAAASQLGIAAHLDKRPFELSGGEKRRAELAAVLVRRPICLLADEPYRGLAPKDAEDLTATFAGLAAGGMAVVVTGHEVQTLLSAADHVSWCTSGTTYDLGPPAVALKSHAFRQEYLGSPGLG
ncbi:MAG: ATP-binding cassette domain-containing protein [Gemmatimonadaceae bacterium]